MLRRILLASAVLSLLAITLTTNRSAKASPDMQTITLNTGFNHDAIPQQAYPTNTFDLFWSVIQDPIGTATSEPRAANTIPPYGFNVWKPPLGASQWISYSSNGSQGIKQGPYYYQKCFCMKADLLWKNPEAISKSILTVSVRADDAFYLGLNTIPNPSNPPTILLKSGSGVGGFNTPPATLTIAGAQLAQMLHAGRNCVNVRVDDIGGVVTGFNLEGTLTTTGIDGIAKASSPKSPAQFDRCSSCFNTKYDKEVELQNSASEIKVARPRED